MKSINRNSPLQKKKYCVVKLHKLDQDTLDTAFIATSSLLPWYTSKSSSIEEDNMRKSRSSALKSTKKPIAVAGSSNSGGHSRSTRQTTSTINTKSITPVQQQKNRVKTDKDLLKYTTPIASERLSKRTPKPNRRYLNDSVVNTLKATEQDSSYETENDDDTQMKTEETSEGGSSIEFENDDDDDDYDEGEEEPITRQIRTRTTRKGNSNVKSDPVKRITRVSFGTASAQQKVKSSSSLQTLNKRKIDFDDSDDNVVKKKLKTMRMRTSRGDDSNSDSLELSVMNKKKSILNNNKINLKPSTMMTTVGSKSKPPIKINLSPTTTTTSSSSAQPSKLQTAHKALSTKLATAAATSPMVAKKSLMQSQLKFNKSTSAESGAIGKNLSQPTKQMPSSKMTNKSSGPSVAAVRKSQLQQSLEDLEDFEQMPTFTIVNINDIMNQKDEIVVIEKSPKQPQLQSSAGAKQQIRKKINAPPKQTRLRKEPDIVNADSDIDYIPDDSDDDEYFNKSQNSSNSPNTTTMANTKGTTNRRKTQHTTILSEKIKQSAKINATNLSTPKILNNITKLTTNNRTTTQTIKPYRNIIGISGKNNGKFNKDMEHESSSEFSPPQPPPRILNSTLCRNKSTIEPNVLNSLGNSKISIISNQKIASPLKHHKNNNINSKLAQQMLLNRSKENLKTYDRTEKNNFPFGKMNSTIQQHHQQQKTIVTQNQILPGGGTRRVRKITCFETWFVIKLPNLEPSIQKSNFDLSLTKLGNDIKEIELPSDQWSYKITLQRKKTIAAGSGAGTGAGGTQCTTEIYSGEVQDSSIDPDNRHLYQPINIMFRRVSTNRELNMQFDRAVIFKNNTFFINVDGKNIKLIGAPQSVQDFQEIETLLQIVDDINLVNPFVEQTTYVI